MPTHASDRGWDRERPTPPRPFRDRADAGRALAARLEELRGERSLVVLGLPRGGVAVAAEVATALDAPLDVALVRRVGLPGHPECTLGAVATGGVVELDAEVVARMELDDEAVRTAVERERAELVRRANLYRAGRLPIPLTGRAVLLIDDGLASGATMRAALAAARRELPKRILAAAPVGSGRACRDIAAHVDECVCAIEAEPFESIEAWYEDFPAIDDRTVLAILAGSRGET